MSNQKLPAQDAALLGCALSVAPAAMGCAVGILLGDRIGKKTRGSAALALFALGAATAMPYVVDYVSKRVNGPTTERGQKRTRQLIRDGVMPEEADFYGFEDELEEAAM